MAALNRKAPDAAATAPRARIVASRKPTRFISAKLHAHKPGFRGRGRIQAVRPAGRFVVTGQDAKALCALVTAEARGVTALEVNSWAYRLGAYVWKLRHRHGLAIETRRELHEGGWHARYVLVSPVTLLEVRRPERRAA